MTRTGPGGDSPSSCSRFFWSLRSELRECFSTLSQALLLEAYLLAAPEHLKVELLDDSGHTSVVKVLKRQRQFLNTLKSITDTLCLQEERNPEITFERRKEVEPVAGSCHPKHCPDFHGEPEEVVQQGGVVQRWQPFRQLGQPGRIHLTQGPWHHVQEGRGVYHRHITALGSIPHLSHDQPKLIKQVGP